MASLSDYCSSIALEFSRLKGLHDLALCFLFNFASALQGRHTKKLHLLISVINISCSLGTRTPGSPPGHSTPDVPPKQAFLLNPEQPLCPPW